MCSARCNLSHNVRRQSGGPYKAQIGFFAKKSASALLATVCSPLPGKHRSFAPFFTVPCWSQRAEQFSIVSTSRLNYWKNCLNLNVERPVANHTLIADLSVLVHSLTNISSSRSRLLDSLGTGTNHMRQSATRASGMF